MFQKPPPYLHHVIPATFSRESWRLFTLFSAVLGRPARRIRPFSRLWLAYLAADCCGFLGLRILLV